MIYSFGRLESIPATGILQSPPLGVGMLPSPPCYQLKRETFGKGYHLKSETLRDKLVEKRNKIRSFNIFARYFLGGLESIPATGILPSPPLGMVMLLNEKRNIFRRFNDFSPYSLGRLESIPATGMSPVRHSGWSCYRLKRETLRY